MSWRTLPDYLFRYRAASDKFNALGSLKNPGISVTSYSIDTYVPSGRPAYPFLEV